MIAGFLASRRTVEVPVTLDLEQTPESFHAYAVPKGVDILPGDVVTVHNAPAGIGFGERLSLETSATVERAGLLERIWTRLTGVLEITELYEVGFQPEE